MHYKPLSRVAVLWGKIHMKSTHGLATPLNITDIVVREITIYSSRCGPFDKAIDGIKFGEIQVDSAYLQNVSFRTDPRRIRIL